MMRFKAIAIAALFAGSIFAADVPRKSPEFGFQLPDGKQATLSSYHGKVVVLAFILTGCPHCQKATQVLSQLQRELGPKGFQVLEAAINPDANIGAFISRFQPPFPVGTAGQLDALQYMHLSPMVRSFMPYISFIDREGVIRSQLTGSDLPDEAQDKVLRDLAENLVNEHSAAHHARPKRASK